jgi:hypothetical protein
MYRNPIPFTFMFVEIYALSTTSSLISRVQKEIEKVFLFGRRVLLLHMHKYLPI